MNESQCSKILILYNLFQSQVPFFRELHQISSFRFACYLGNCGSTQWQSNSVQFEMSFKHICLNGPLVQVSNCAFSNHVITDFLFSPNDCGAYLYVPFQVGLGLQPVLSFPFFLIFFNLQDSGFFFFSDTL